MVGMGSRNETVPVSENEVVVTRHAYDMDNLAKETAKRVDRELQTCLKGALYFNPVATVRCAEPSEEFLSRVRKEQARWCRQASGTFPRGMRRKSRNWISGDHCERGRETRYFHRALCWTGVLFLNGRQIFPHDWPKVVKRRNSTGR